MSSKGRSLGQREEKMKAIVKVEHQRIIFSKYKQEIFKKAAELSTQCGVDIAILLFSPKGNTVYSFGSPSVDSIITRFLGENGRLDALRRELRWLEKQVKAEKERGKALDVACKKWEDYINGLGWEELLQVIGKLEGLKRNAHAELQKKDAVAASASCSSSMSGANYGPPAEEIDDEITDTYRSP